MEMKKLTIENYYTVVIVAWPQAMHGNELAHKLKNTLPHPLLVIYW